MPPDTPATILIVDDNPANMRLLTEILGSHGYSVRAATSGPRALASADLTPPDLILLDIRMPGMDGYEVCRQLKANPKTAAVPVLFISALDDIDDKVRAFETGGLDYITKPFHVEEVLARVETHLSLRRLRRSLEEANRRMARELALAAQVQASFMQRDLPAVPGYGLAVRLVPARQTSGDFYDVVRLPDGRVALLIADVVDKGVGAALYMAMSCALLRSFLVQWPDEPERVLCEVNQRLLAYATADQFVTVFLGVLDPAAGALHYANAGHNPPILIGAPEQPPQLLTNTGPPLAVVEDAAWRRWRVDLARGDTAVFYTDGVTEAENAADGFYGLDRLLAAVHAALGEPADTVRDAILADVQRYTDDSHPADDIALMVLTRDA